MRTGLTLKPDQSGLSLVVTLVIAAGVSVLVGGVLYYTSSQSSLTRRMDQYNASVAAAVAATEKVVTRINKDFQGGGDATVINNMATYRGLVPTDEEVNKALSDASLLQTVVSGVLGGGGSGTSGSSTTRPVWSKYEFADSSGQLNRTYVEKTSDWSFRDLQTKFSGLKGYAANYRVISNARQLNRTYNIVSAVKQDIQIASIPLSQYQLFYGPDLELNPSAAGIRLNGRIHGNANMYFQPGIDVSFENHVTAARKIFHQKNPLDPVARGSGRVSYRAERESGANTLNLPIGPTTGNELHQILEAPPATELVSSVLGKERFYNKADLVVIVSNDVVTARSGSYNGGSVTVPWLAARGIVTRNAQGFYESRQCEDVQLSEFDVSKLLLNYTDLTTLLGRAPKVIWIMDLGGDGSTTDSTSVTNLVTGPGKGRGKPKKPKKQTTTLLPGTVVSNPTNELTGLRVINAQTLPTAGLTLATPDPLYVWGTFNANGAPACLAADAVSVLSGNWLDAGSTNNVSLRVARDTTVNAAIITGIVPTSAGYYSGGAENTLRLLEDWTGKTLTFSGSIAVLYFSDFAAAPWGGSNVYAPPTRAWSYDTRLSELATTPPGMPAARTVLRNDWTLIKPYSKL